MNQETKNQIKERTNFYKTTNIHILVLQQSVEFAQDFKADIDVAKIN